jgi:hypothetical protein
MEKQRINEEEREEKILMLLNRCPGRFSIKEISDIYYSMDSQGLNRNSLRKTLNKLVESNKINCTRDGSSTKGHGTYFGISSNDVFRRIAKSLPVEQESIAKNVGASIVERTFQEIFSDTNRSSCDHETADDIAMHLKYSYPFIDFSFAHEDRSISVTTKIEVHMAESNVEKKYYSISDVKRNFKVSIDKCLCNGETDLEALNSCNMVSGALEASFTEQCGFNVNVNKIETDSNSICYYSIELLKSNGKPKEKLQNKSKEFDLDDPVIRNYTIPSL